MQGGWEAWLKSWWLNVALATALGAFGALCGACTTVVRVPPSQLAELNGFAAGQLVSPGQHQGREALERSLRDEAGTQHRFDVDTRLVIGLKPDCDSFPCIESRYRAVRVDGGEFRGLPVGSENEVVLHMDDIQYAGVRELSAERTLVLAGVVVSAVAAAVLAVVLSPDHSAATPAATARGW